METFSALLVLCAGNSSVNGEFHTQRPVTRSYGASFICVWINGWATNREAGDLRCHRAHYNVTVMAWHHLVDAVAKLTKVTFCVLRKTILIIGYHLLTDFTNNEASPSGCSFIVKFGKINPSFFFHSSLVLACNSINAILTVLESHDDLWSARCRRSPVNLFSV